MILPDVNVLLYAFRTDAVNHAKYHAWLEGVINGDAAFGMSPQVLAGVIRVTTHPAIYAQPTPLDEVVRFASLLLHQPNCHVITPGPRHWEIFADLCRSSNAKGNLVSDAWYAALAIESGSEWITTDRDYARFSGLNWRAPL